MTNTQKICVQTEKELFATVFGCTRFHQYLYGKQAKVESDHSSLEMIFKKPYVIFH